MEIKLKNQIRRGAPANQQTASAPHAALVSDSAYAVGTILGSTQPLEILVKAMKVRLEALQDPTSAAGLAELTRQLLPLEALYLRFSEEASTSERSAASRVLLLRAAIQAQQAYARTFALLHTLARQGKQGETSVIVLHPDSEGSGSGSGEGNGDSDSEGNGNGNSNDDSDTERDSPNV